MSLLFMDGFDHYVTADLTKKWTLAGGGFSVGAVGRRSGNGVSGTTNTSNLIKTLAATAGWVCGFAFKTSGAPTTPRPVCALLDAGSAQCEVRLNVDLTLSVTRNGVALTGGTSTSSLSADVFYFIEFKATIANSISAGTCKVRVNGVDWIAVATSQDIQNTANATANQFKLGTDGSFSATWSFDDVYVCDQNGSTNNDFLGDVRIDTLLPTSDGNYSQFSPSTGTSHYALVDETAPNGTDYNDGSTVGHRDSYGLGNLSALASQTVYGVQVNAAVLKDDAGAKSAATMVRSGSTDSDGASAALGTSQVYVSQVYEQDPAATAAWTETTVNAMEAGVIVTA